MVDESKWQIQKNWDWMGNPRSSPSGRTDEADCYIQVAVDYHQWHIWHYCHNKDGCRHQWKGDVTDFSEAVKCQKNIFWNYNIEKIKNNCFILVSENDEEGIPLPIIKYWADTYPKQCSFRGGDIFYLGTEIPRYPDYTSCDIIVADRGNMPAIFAAVKTNWRRKQEKYRRKDWRFNWGSFCYSFCVFFCTQFVLATWMYYSDGVFYPDALFTWSLIDLLVAGLSGYFNGLPRYVPQIFLVFSLRLYSAGVFFYRALLLSIFMCIFY